MEKQVIVDRRPGSSAAGIVLLVVVVLLLAWLFFMNGTDRTTSTSSQTDSTLPANNTTPTNGQTNAGANAAVPSDSNLTAARTSARSAVLSLQGRVGADSAYANTDTDLEAVQNSLDAAYVNASGDAATKYAQIKTELSTLREAAQNDVSAMNAASFDDLLRLLAS